MRNVLADLAVEAEAATIVAMRMAGATDAAVRGDERETLLRRIGLAASKYWVCKRATPHAAEAMECLGGNGYVEESGMPRLYREAPLMGIWEGSGNVSALDTVARHGNSARVCRRAVRRAGQDHGPGSRVWTPTSMLSSRRWRISRPSSDRARKIAEDISSRCRARCWCATSHPAVAEASWPPARRCVGRAHSEHAHPGWIRARSLERGIVVKA
jgi:putative acyl-CoA dehydrogenase